MLDGQKAGARSAWGVVRTLLALCGVALGACGDDDGGGGTGATEGPLYAVMYEVYTDEGSDSYLSVFNSLDLTEVDTASAREFSGGRAFMQAYNGWIFVGEPASPNLRRFSLNAAGELDNEEILNFSNYGLTEVAIDDWCINFLSPEKAYYFEYLEGTTIVFNPTTMEITGEIPAPNNYVSSNTDEYTSTSTAVVRGDRLFRTMYWQNDDTAAHSAEQTLLVYDTENDMLIDEVVETRCPGTGNRAHLAEDGTIYFSAWIWQTGDSLFNGAAAGCVLRINPGEETFDASWTFDYGDVAGGRQGAMFTYLEDGQALVSIFHDENVDIESFESAWDAVSEPQWEVWSVDIAARTGSPISGIPFSAGAFTPVHIDGRVFVMIPDSEWANTQLYEVEGNSATPKVNIPGWSYMFSKVR